MYYAGKSVTIYQPGNVIGRSTSNISPHGPWTRNNDTLLTVGSAGEWDSEFILPTCIIKNGTELIMYSFAGSYWPGPGQIGMATSLDGGATWQKYDDPTTTLPPYSESDPVLKPDRPYDNFGILGCTVLKTLTGWEMLYAGENNTVSSICYATSVDGINWVKDSVNNPIFVPSQDPLAYYNLFEMPAVVLFDNKYFMYYDYGVGPSSAGIGLAIADIVVPVELTSFTATTNGKEVILNWSTATELNNQGFEIERASSKTSPRQEDWEKIGFIPGFGTTTEPKSYSYSDQLINSGTFYYRLKQVEYDGSYEYSGVVEVKFSAVNLYLLEQNYPNPFNPSTTIEYQLGSQSYVKIVITNILGEVVSILEDGLKNVGNHKSIFDARNLSSGIYYY